MRVTVLGTGTALPDPERGPTAVLVENGTTSVLIDAGSGTLGRLARTGHSTLSIDALLLTHAHLDHVADVLPLVFTFVVPYVRRNAPLPIIGSARTLGIVRSAMAAFGEWLDGREQIEFREVSGTDTFVVGTLRVETGLVDHDPGSIAWRLSPLDRPDRIVAVPGDSGPCEALEKSIAHASLAVIECGMDETMAIDGHLTPASLAAAAGRAGVKRLLVVHRYPPLSLDDTIAARIRAAGFVGRIEVPDDLDVFEVD